MSKYLELFKESFNDSINEKTKLENKPYIGYSLTEGKVVYTVVPKEPTSVYQMVDLGLPSGLKWADRNVGAATPQDNGLYFSWGNVDGHAVDENGNVIDEYSFNSTTYSTSLGGQYTGLLLDAEHDAATVNMSSDWRMPTVDETVELVENTEHYYIGDDGSVVAGPFNHETKLSKKGLNSSKLRSICFVKKGEPFDYNVRFNFIEFPFAGICMSSFHNGGGFNGNILSSSAYGDSVINVHDLSFNTGGTLDGDNYNNRGPGMSVRGVHA